MAVAWLTGAREARPTRKTSIGDAMIGDEATGKKDTPTAVLCPYGCGPLVVDPEIIGRAVTDSITNVDGTRSVWYEPLPRGTVALWCNECESPFYALESAMPAIAASLLGAVVR